MTADVAGGRGAENRVGHRVADRVGVGMAVEPFVERNRHAAEDQRPPGDEPMQVVAVADPQCGGAGRRAERAAPPSSRSSGVVIFRLRGSPSTSVHVMPGLLGEHRLVGRIGTPSTRAPARRAARRAERLRRLREEDLLARQRAANDARRVAALHRVARLQRGNRGAVLERRRRWSARSARGDTNGRAASWMHDHLRARRDTRERVGHRILPARAARDDDHVVEIRRRARGAARPAARRRLRRSG